MTKDGKGPLGVPGLDHVQREVDEEVRFHLDRKIEKLRAAGMSEEEARAEASRRFGDLEAVKHAMERESERREGTMRGFWDRSRQDFAYALRQLRRSPGFTAVTVLTLTLGIGATTAIFSVVDGILFRPLPYEEPDRLVRVWSDWTRRGGPVNEWPNFPSLWRLRELGRSFESLSIWSGAAWTVTGLGPAEQVSGIVVDHRMLGEVLRVQPVLGRGFAPEDDVPGAPGTAIVTHGFWRRALGGDPAAVGRTLDLNGQAYTVIGVLGERFRPAFQPGAEIWVPLRMDIEDHGCGRGGACIHGIARLAQGVTLEAARTEAAEIARLQEQEDPEASSGRAWNLQPLQGDLVANARVSLLVLMGAALAVLLIACVNQANLLLARGTVRRGELAVRAAIGAGRSRIVAQLLIESFVLAAVGGAVAIGGAYLLADLLVGLAPAGTPRIEEVVVDARVLGFAVGITLLCGLLFGLFPAFRAAGGALQDTLREGGRGSTRAAGARARAGLVAGQVALALILLVGSGLLIRSFQKLRDLDLGFDPQGVLAFRVNVTAARYENAAAIRSFDALLEERLGAIPGVSSVGTTSNLPLAGLNGDVSFTIEGRPVPPPEQMQAVWFRRVTPGHHEALRMRIVSGRGIEAGDGPDAPRIVVITETFARRYFPDQDPIGQRLTFGNPDKPEWWQIVGISADVKHFSLRGDAQGADPSATGVALYAPFQQSPTRTMFLALRSERDLGALAEEVRGVLASVDPQLAAAGLEPMERYVGDSLAADRFVTMLLTLFAGVALALAAIGLYGVVSYNVNSRLREMGVRLALGASGGEVGGLVVWRSLRVVALGLAVGMAGALGLTRVMRTLLFGVSATDPLTFIAVALVLAGAAALAAALPARRAARLDPVSVLRSD